MKQLFKYVSAFATCISFIIACNTKPNSPANHDSGMSTQTGVDTVVNSSDSNAVVKTPQTNDANVVMDDDGFISKNIIDNEMEVELATVGVNKLSSASLKRAAAQIKKDHTQMLNDLKTLAARKQVTVPAMNTAMSATASLPTVAGKEFDLAWVNQMSDMHNAKLTELENALKQTSDADTKALATKALPVIKMHIDILAQAGL